MYLVSNEAQDSSFSLERRMCCGATSAPKKTPLCQKYTNFPAKAGKTPIARAKAQMKHESVRSYCGPHDFCCSLLHFGFNQEIELTKDEINLAQCRLTSFSKMSLTNIGPSCKRPVCKSGKPIFSTFVSASKQCKVVSTMSPALHRP